MKYLMYFYTNGLNKIIVLSYCLFVFNSVYADEIDVMHFWVSPSERSAMNVFKNSYRDTGHDWIDDAQENYSVLKDNALSRIADGYPPTAMQWLASENFIALVNSGVLRTFEYENKPKGLSQLHPILLQAVTHDNKIGAIPVSIHGENWSYYNANIMNTLNLLPPKNWDEFFEHMRVIENAGYKTIALGSGQWEVEVVFKTLLVATGGLPLIKGIRNGYIDKNMEQQLEKAFDYLIQYRDTFDRSGLITESWDAAANAVIKEQAAVQIMGDWAKGEMIYRGAEPGKDFLCAMAPGNDSTYLLSVDTFVLPITNSESDKKLQNTFVDVVLNPQNQIEFSRRKGTIPVRNDIKNTDLDICGQIGYSVFSKEGAATLSLLESSVSLYINALGGVIQRVWSKEINTCEDAKQAMIEEMDIIRGI